MAQMVRQGSLICSAFRDAKAWGGTEMCVSTLVHAAERFWKPCELEGDEEY